MVSEPHLDALFLVQSEEVLGLDGRGLGFDRSIEASLETLPSASAFAISFIHLSVWQRVSAGKTESKIKGGWSEGIRDGVRFLPQLCEPVRHTHPKPSSASVLGGQCDIPSLSHGKGLSKGGGATSFNHGVERASPDGQPNLGADDSNLLKGKSKEREKRELANPHDDHDRSWVA
ncbi:hypothetical protein IE53DRAFT_383880 [Violaceomyces palustris]|uniref:Uncharacterized protein n=1 Tax=Violaceomyces palustris TaxID=1673888 RepID=A0ACD0P650_9BASI|nr:hypothetical protein IE53DRAFT_383880 [Violaceomyces palustris]